MDEWMDRLREHTDDVRPTGDAHARITEEMGRRRRRRHGLTAVGAVASVAIVVAAGTGVPRLIDEDQSAPVDPATTATTTTADVDAADFTCPRDNPVFTDDPPPIPDLARQRQIADEVTRPPVGPDFHVNVARPTPFGVVALVTGDVEIARAALTPQGVALVYPFDPSGEDVGLDSDAQLDQVVLWQLGPLLRYAKRATQGVEGQAGFAYWDEAGAILVQWKEPVPEQVRSLEDVQFESGGQIIVRGVTYSAADVWRAHRALNRWLRTSGLRDHWSMSVACGDFSGLEVGMMPDWLADQDVTALEAEIAEAIGMPAHVVPEEVVASLG